jgi:hypothetical protein
VLPVGSSDEADPKLSTVYHALDVKGVNCITASAETARPGACVDSGLRDHQLCGHPDASPPDALDRDQVPALSLRALRRGPHRGAA